MEINGFLRQLKYQHVNTEEGCHGFYEKYDVL